MRAEIDFRGWLERGRKQVKAKLTQGKQMAKNKCAQAQIEAEGTLKRAFFYLYSSQVL